MPSRTAQELIQDSRIVEREDARLFTRIYGLSGDAPVVTILPMLGRGASDFTEEYGSNLTTRLVEAGFRVLLVDPRGTGGSSGDLTPDRARVERFADDVEAAMDAFEVKRAHFIGHGVGNRIARTSATYSPERVDRLALLSVSGPIPLSEDQRRTIRGAFDELTPDAERMAIIRKGFFAEGNDPTPWRGGWHGDLALAQLRAVEASELAPVFRAGGKPFLLVQALDDFTAPPELVGRKLKREFGDQATYLEIANTGHAMIPERPDEVADALIRYLTA